MIGRIENALRRLRAELSRSEWLARLLGLQVSAGTSRQRGLVMVQIDGLSHHEMSRALAHGEMPLLRRLIEHEHYRLRPMYAGVPSMTAAAQGELFYGVRQAVPGFGFMDRETGELVRMIEPGIAAKVERALDKRSSRPLLQGGSGYGNNFTGGAEEPHFCPTARGWGMAMRDASPLAVLALIASNLFSFVRVAALMLLEFVIAVIDLFRGVLTGRKFTKELKFIPVRVAITILLRELVVIGDKIDIARGLPVVHLNLLGYDEQAHRRGADSRFAHWTLKGIDNAVLRLWKALHRSQRRQYELWVYSDHGQEDVTPYEILHGKTFAEAASGVFADWSGAPLTCQVSGPLGVEFQRSEQLGTRFPEHFLRRDRQTPAFDHRAGDQAELTVAALGPVAMIYWHRSLAPDERRELARRLASDANAPAVLYRDEDDSIAGWLGDRAIRLPEHAAELLGKRHPFLEEAAADLADLCRHENIGDLVAFGTGGGIATPLSFALENGAHGGPSEAETGAFVLTPEDARLPAHGTIRLRDLREAALTEIGEPLDEENERSAARATPQVTSRTLRVATYNVHSCIGMDGRLSPERIARVIARCEPDIVCLQELDMRRARTEGIDQAHRIAEILDMHYHFHPALHIEEERYGDAILTNLPMRTVKTAALPHWRDLKSTEPRGALWVEVEIGGTRVQIVNTHLGLRARDRKLQMEALLGDEWLGHPDCRSPVVFCGDLNALPGSRVYKMLGRRLLDAQRVMRRHRPRATFSGRFPSARIDHVFVDAGVDVRSIEVPNNELCRLASDHLPLVVEIQVPDVQPAARSAAAQGSE